MTKNGLFVSFTQGCGCAAALRLGYHLSLLRSFRVEEVFLCGVTATLRYKAGVSPHLAADCRLDLIFNPLNPECLLTPAQ